MKAEVWVVNTCLFHNSKNNLIKNSNPFLKNILKGKCQFTKSCLIKKITEKVNFTYIIWTKHLQLSMVPGCPVPVAISWRDIVFLYASDSSLLRILYSIDYY